jgi:hypothetical protein
MKDEILGHLDSPAELEKIYRSSKLRFKREFGMLYPELKGNIIADFWNERLNYEGDDINWGTAREILLVIAASLLAGFIVKLPALFSINEEFFYTRNVGFIFLPLLGAYFGWKNRLSAGKVVFLTCGLLAGLVFINAFPAVKKSDTLDLSSIHVVLFIWSLLGFAFVAGEKKELDKRLGFLRFNGDLVVMTTLILIAGALMSGITVGLFSLIGFNIGELYFNNVGIVGLAAAPIVGTYLTQTNPQLIGKVSPVIAKLFSPLVLVMLLIYLIAILYSGKDPYNDREFLMIFNALLIGVMAIIFFSVAEATNARNRSAEIWVLLLLSIVTIVVNGIALSAILFRISEWGITPNRAAVLGANILVLANLLLVTAQFFRVLTKKADLSAVGKVIAFYLPIYCLWTIVVTFIFPFIFGFK